MATTTRRAGAGKASRSSSTNGTRPAAPALPKITVMRFEDAGQLLERLYDDNVDTFIARGQDYRDRHRGATSRPLTVQETVMVAGGLSATIAEAQEQIDEAGLTNHDEPSTGEVLLAAGLSTAPAFMRSVRRLVALIELDPDVYRQAREQGLDGLWAAVDAAAEQLLELDLDEGRARAQRALEHLADSAGVPAGKAWGLVANTVWQAMSQAAHQLGERMRSASSTSSAASTADSPEPKSSTSSATETPSSSSS
jgi:hypothetical protein